MMSLTKEVRLMSEKRRHFPHAVGSSKWHFQWCSKYRYRIFVSECVKSMCMLALQEAAKRYGIEIQDMEVQPEHIHMIATIPLSMAPDKGIYGKAAFQDVPEAQAQISQRAYLEPRQVRHIGRVHYA